MFRHGEFSTETDKKPFVFTLSACVCCIAAAVILFIAGKGDALSIFAGALLSVVGIAAFSVLFAMVTDRAYVEGDALHMSYLLKRKTIALPDIGKVTFKDDVYTVYDKKGAVAGTINANLTGIGRVLHALDRKGIQFV